MTTKKNIITTILAAALLVSMTGTAFAAYYDCVVVDPFDQTIGIENTANYTVTVYTNVGGDHNLSFDTNEPLLYARLSGPQGGDANGNTYITTMNSTGSITWAAYSYPAAYTFIYEVQPQDGIECTNYSMTITDAGGSVIGDDGVTATVTPAASVVPELPAFALAGIGAVVGLIALGRRKD
jgi:hypothetical protein